MNHDHMSMTMNSEMQACIQACQDCHDECLKHASLHCLEVGGMHVEPTHFRLMLSCAEICQTSANMMLMGSEHHRDVCAVCAQVCEACAASCAKLEDMESCVQACRRCAESCRQMAGQAMRR
jgi:hypothetical protein